MAQFVSPASSKGIQALFTLIFVILAMHLLAAASRPRLFVRHGAEVVCVRNFLICVRWALLD